jgi:hypothetical protein
MLFGSALFVLYSGPTRSRSERLVRLLPKVFSACAIGALLSGVAWFLFTVGNMSGTLAGAFDTEALWSVVVRYWLWTCVGCSHRADAFHCRDGLVERRIHY